MNDLLTYIGEGGIGAGLIFVCWKYAFPFIKGLYKELLALRKENTELKEKMAYFKGKYMDKVVLKSHGKKLKDGEI